ENEYDCIARMRDSIIEAGVASESQIEGWEAADKEAVEAARDLAWEAFQAQIRAERDTAVGILRRIDMPEVAEITNALDEAHKVTRAVVMSSASRALHQTRGIDSPERAELARFVDGYRRENDSRYNSFLYSRSADSPLKVPVVAPVYSDKSPTVDGRMVLLRNFDGIYARDPRSFVVGEDVGRLGDVNLVFEGLQAKYGDLRLTDTGIREATILGQTIGAAMRGLRPICDIQYLDYFLYALEVASDDLATLHWRTVGGQKAPVVIRTKGHRLVGIWHSGSPMSVLLNALRGDRCADAEPVRRRPHACALGREDARAGLRRRGRARWSLGVHAAADPRGAAGLVAPRRCTEDARGLAEPAGVRTGRGLFLETQPGEHRRGRVWHRPGAPAVEAPPARRLEVPR